MKVLFPVNTSLEFEPPIFALSQMLARNGEHVHLLGYANEGLKATEVYSPNIIIQRCDRGKWNFLPRIFRGAFRHIIFSLECLDYARKNIPDIIFVSSYDVLPIGVILSKLYSVDLLYYCTEISELPELQDYLIGWGFLKIIEKRLIIYPKKIISVEKNRAKIQEDQWGRKVDYVILNAPLFDENLHDMAMNAINNRDPEIKLVYAGSIGKRNQLQTIIDQILDMKEVEFHIYGRIDEKIAGSFHQYIDQVSRDTNGRVKYCGITVYKELAITLQNYDFGINSYDDSSINVRLASPAKLFEYMRSGLGVITTNQPTPAEIIRECENGFVIPSDDPEKFTAFLNEVQHNQESIIRFRKNSLLHFRKQFCYDRQAEVLINWLSKEKTS